MESKTAEALAAFQAIKNLLIEPVWNRKLFNPNLQTVRRGSPFNRNQYGIETSTTVFTTAVSSTLLIEPVWNRNVSLQKIAFVLVRLPFNRTSMESKPQETTSASFSIP